MEIYDFGLRLKELRKAKGLSQKEVADRLSLSRTTLTGFENNTITPRVEHLVNLAHLYNTSVDYILGIDNRPCIFLDDLTDSQQEAVRDVVARMKQEFQK